MGVCNSSQNADKSLEAADPGTDVTVDNPPFAVVGEAPFTVDLSAPDVDVAAPLDERDIELVQQTFARVAMLGAESVGWVLFMNIFEIAPAAKELFPFKDEDLSTSTRMRSHAGKVVSTVGTAISLLRDLDTLVPVLHSLGLRHVGYSVVPEHYDVVGQALIKSLNTALGANMTPAVTNAYLKVFTIVKTTMLEKCDYASLAAASLAAPEAAPPEAAPAPAPAAEPAAEPEAEQAETPPDVTPSGEITAKDIDLVQSTWDQAKGLGVETVGVLLFQNIFEAAPEALQLFPFKDEPKLYESTQLKGHAVKVVTTVDVAVSKLLDLPNLVPVLQTLASRHVGYGVLPVHYPIVGAALLKTLKGGLGEAFTAEVEQAWIKVWSLVASTMISSLDVKPSGKIAEKEEKDNADDAHKKKAPTTVKGMLGSLVKKKKAPDHTVKKKKEEDSAKKKKSDEDDAEKKTAEEKQNTEEAAKEKSNPDQELIAAASQGDDKTVAKLLKAGANVNATDAEGKTPLHWAAEKGNEDLCGRLTSVKKVKIGAKTLAKKDTPLHLACREGHKDCAVMIVRAGASLIDKNKDGKTAVEITKDDALAKWLRMSNPAGTPPPWQGAKMK